MHLKRRRDEQTICTYMNSFGKEPENILLEVSQRTGSEGNAQEVFSTYRGAVEHAELLTQGFLADPTDGRPY